MNVLPFLTEFLSSPPVLLGGILGALLGAGITVWRTRYSVRHNDFSRRVDTLCEVIDQLIDSSCRARTGLGKDNDVLKSSKSYCIALLARIDDMLVGLDADFNGFRNSSVTAAYVAFSTSSTGGSFETFETEPEDKVREIILTGGRLKDVLNKVRMSKY